MKLKWYINTSARATTNIHLPFDVVQLLPYNLAIPATEDAKFRKTLFSIFPIITAGQTDEFGQNVQSKP
jgi:hypothetical protein